MCLRACLPPGERCRGFKSSDHCAGVGLRYSSEVSVFYTRLLWRLGVCDRGVTMT